jgi:hypothetical protein
MIVPKPTDAQIRSAHVITLYDPRLPEFSRVLVSEPASIRQKAKDFVVLDIPVDSTDLAEVERLKQWVASLRSNTAP